MAGFMATEKKSVSTPAAKRQCSSDRKYEATGFTARLQQADGGMLYKVQWANYQASWEDGSVYKGADFKEWREEVASQRCTIQAAEEGRPVMKGKKKTGEQEKHYLVRWGSDAACWERASYCMHDPRFVAWEEARISAA